MNTHIVWKQTSICFKQTPIDGDKHKPVFENEYPSVVDKQGEQTKRQTSIFIYEFTSYLYIESLIGSVFIFVINCSASYLLNNSDTNNCRQINTERNVQVNPFLHGV